MSRRYRNRPNKRAPLPEAANDPEAPDSWDAWHEEQRQPPTDENYWRDAADAANSGTESLNMGAP